MASPLFFATPATFRAWLEKNHDKEAELWVGFYRRDSGKPSITWPESVDEALCVGWIDGVRKSVDDTSYKIRFTPRKPSSIWSNVNVANVERLSAEGRMRKAGLEAFARKSDARSGVYAYEGRATLTRDNAQLEPEAEIRFRKNQAAWAFFEAQPPGYRKIALFYVASAKRPETRAKRVASLIELSAKGKRLS